ncbi:hypothetical protein GCM10010975_07060 [Comamonas phosphati]|nr:hypothetical protein GCM10010975_07060 [Comamonas phosphati]
MAGRFSLGGYPGRPLGEFQYGEAYLAHSGRISLDQRQLLRFKGTARTTDYGGLFDIFRDVRPEGFGLDMLYRRRAVTSMSDLDVLEYSAGDAVGALEVCDDIQAKMDFVPESSQTMFGVMEELEPSQSNAHIATRLERLPSTSLGGERPKITVLHKGQLWIAKFAGSKDDPSSPLREYLCMTLAAMAGIDAAQVEFVQRRGRGAVLVKRFDRWIDAAGKCRRMHFASGATMLGAATASRDAPGRTYLSLAGNALRWGVAGHMAELWRRMAFNVLVGNGDDHPRNHGFLRREGGWQLSPAYDIAPYTPHGGQALEVKALSMGLLRNGDAGANADNLLLAARQFGIGYGEANDYLDNAYQLIHEKWGGLAKDAGETPLAPPLFKLPVRPERMPEPVWQKTRR